MDTRLLRLLYRKKSVAEGGNRDDLLRLSGTTTNIESDYNKVAVDGQLGSPIGRQGNDWEYPDTNGAFNQQANGDRLQDFANTHLHEGPPPGKIPHLFNMRVHGKTGGVTGTPTGEIGSLITVTGQSAGGIGDMAHIPHIQIVRGRGIAKPYLRTVDDAANVPGIFIADPNRH